MSEKYSEYSLRFGSFAKKRADGFYVWDFDKETLFDRTWFKEEVVEFNKITVDKNITKPMEAIEITQQFADIYTGGCPNEQPFMIQYIEKNNTWIVIGDILQRTWYKDLYHDITKTSYGILGGELCLVIDAETGNVVFMDHTQ